jgi:hypothetical protein
MKRYRIELASRADDADLRFILANTPMPGSIALAFQREPCFFAAAEVEGRERQVVVARESTTNRVVGFGCRSLRQGYVNGRNAAVGYLSGLRLLPEHRQRGLVARGYRFFKRLHQDARVSLYLTTIAQDNTPAVDLLTSRRAGLPAYHFAGKYHTVALPLRRRWWVGGDDMQIRPAVHGDREAILAFWHEHGPRRQFFPHYGACDLFQANGALQGLQASDVLLAYRGSKLVGTLGAWDQGAFRQTVVQGYGPALRWLRPLVNLWATVRGGPRLPPAGSVLRYLTAAVPLAAADDAGVLSRLLAAAQARYRAGPYPYFLVGLHETDPLLSALRRLPGRWYTTLLFLVCWQDGEPFRQALDGRPVYLELGSL